MLYLIQDPTKKYPIMEENPLHSGDVLYGVPQVFKDILTDIIENGGYSPEKNNPP